MTQANQPAPPPRREVKQRSELEIRWRQARNAPPPVVRGDRTLVERVASRDIGDRDAVKHAGVSVAGRVINENDAGPLEHHIVEWDEAAESEGAGS